MAMVKQVLYTTEKVKVDSYEYYQFLLFAGKRFLYTIKFRNGYPIGFDVDRCISVMKDDGTWGPVVDIRMVGCEVNLDYYCSEEDKKSRRDKIVESFDKFLQAVYGYEVNIL